MSGEDRASLGVALAWIVLLAFAAFLCAVSLASAQISATNLQSTLTGWDTCYIGSCQGGSPGGSGTPSSTSQTINNASPSVSGASMLLSQTTSEDTTNVLWTYKDPSTCDECLNVESDFWVYLDSNAATVRAFEYDNFVFDATDDAEFMFGMQWDQADGVWDVWNQKTGAWVATSLTTALSYTTWHHIQVFDHRVRGDTNSCSGEPCMYFDSITIDGATTMLNMSEPASAMPSGWTSAVGTQFQIGGSDSVSGSTTYSEYIDDVNFYANGTSVSVPTASGSGIKISGIIPPGVNIGGTTPANYGRVNIAANLLFSMNGYFGPQVWASNSYCYSGTTTTWTDNSNGSNLPENFFEGASYAVVSGTDAGDTGTITASTAGGGGRVIFTLSPALGSACAANDAMTLRQFSPASDWTGALTPSGMTTLYYNWFNSSTGATASFETADLSPDTAQTQALQIAAPGSDSGQLYFIQDTDLVTALNGTYTMSFRAKGTTGTPTVTVTVWRGSTTYVNQTVTPTVNSGDGEGWTNYSYSFTASETVPTDALTVSLTVTDGTAILADVALTQTPVSGNTTPLSNAAYEELLAMHPGVIRLGAQNSWGCPIQDELSEDDAVQMCGFNFYSTGVAMSPAFTLPDTLAIANAVGRAPWYILSQFATSTDGAAIVEYLAGACDNGNQYTAMRCDQGQTTPWTSVFANKGQKIYIEVGNEMWNAGANGAGSLWHSDAYGTQVGNVDAGMKGAADWTSEIVRVADGWQAASQATGTNSDWLEEVMSNSSAITNGQPDAIDGAPYLGTFVTQASDNAAIFPPMFSEVYSMDSTDIGDEAYTPMQTTSAWLAANYPATKLLVYEESVDNAQYFLTGTTSSQIDGIAAGVGAGIASVLHQLLLMRDSGVVASSMYAVFQGNDEATLCTSTTGGCSTSGTTPVWGSNLYNTATAELVDRPVGYAFQIMNSAIGSNDNLLNLTLTDQPTYSQAAAQPDPTDSGADSIYANSSVPYVDAFGFSDGNGHYSLIAFNTNVAASESITFAGAAAPTGNVTRTVFTSTNPTDNNESTAVGGTPTVPLPTSTTVNNPTGDTLPADSMVTYTWTVGTTPTAPTLSGGIEVSGGVTIQ